MNATATRQPTPRELRACGGSMEAWLAKQARIEAGVTRQPTPAEIRREALKAKGGSVWFSGEFFRVYFNEVKIGNGVATFYFTDMSEVVIVSRAGCTIAQINKFASTL